MEGSNNNNYPQYPYSFPPPTWVDPYQPTSSSSSSVPKWVIAAIVLAVAILVFFLFWHIRRREKKIEKEAATKAAAKAEADKAAAQAKPAEKKKPPEKPMEPRAVKLTPKERISIPNSCKFCGHEGGFYQFNYRCPWCKKGDNFSFSYPSP